MKKSLILSLMLCCVVAVAQDVSIVASKVIPESPAAKAGLLAGDRIVEIDDNPILSQDDLQSVLDGFSPGDTTSIVVQRGSETKTLSLTFGERGDGKASMGVMLQVAMGVMGGTDPAVDTQRPIDDAHKAEVLETVASSLREGYVFETKGNKFAQQIEKAVKQGRFAEAATLAEFVANVNEYLYEISNDKHLRIGYGGTRLEPNGPKRVVKVSGGEDPQPAHGTPEDHGKKIVRRGPGGGPDSSYGFREAKVLDGNIGYLDLGMFAGDESAKAAADAAMLELVDADALIIDLGRNGGGGPWMVRYLSGFLFAEKTHLTDTMARGMDAPAERWTLGGQPTDAFHDKPVYILTSGRTFSAAESFTFGLKINDRVTLVGERTGGGGHFGEDVALGEDLRMFLPVGRTYDPATGLGWEAEGIAPDIEVAYSQASERAVKEATR
jgi:hypothetical protein